MGAKVRCIEFYSGPYLMCATIIQAKNYRKIATEKFGHFKCIFSTIRHGQKETQQGQSFRWP